MFLGMYLVSNPWVKPSWPPGALIYGCIITFVCLLPCVAYVAQVVRSRSYFPQCNIYFLNILRSGTDLISLLILLLFFFLFLLGRPLRKKPKAPSLQIGSGWKLAGLFFIYAKYTSIDEVGFSIWRHAFRVAAVTSFRAEKCCHLGVNMRASTSNYAAAFLKFLIYSAFVYFVKC